MAPQVSKDYASGAFEVKLIYEISKALMASHELFTVTCISLFNLIRFFMFSSSKLWVFLSFYSLAKIYVLGWILHRKYWGMPLST